MLTSFPRAHQLRQELAVDVVPWSGCPPSVADNRCRKLDKPHHTILNDLVGEVLPDVDVLGLFASADDVVAPFDAHCVVLVYRGGLVLFEPEAFQESPEVQDLTSSCLC